MRRITSFHVFQVEREKRRARRNFRVTRRGRMMASNASQSTIRKIATPAANGPGDGIMCGIVPVWAFDENVRKGVLRGGRRNVPREHVRPTIPTGRRT